jgi:hypothetical protein
MKSCPSFFRIISPLAVLLLAGTVQASTTIDGIAVDAAGGDAADEVGSTGTGASLTDAIKYYIPLGSSYAGVYGVGSSPCTNGAGTCSDTGSGYGYDNADALKMNIFFDLSGQPASQSAELSFQFDDLDLTGVNDPAGFFESISLSYWNWDGSTFDTTVGLSGTIKDAITPPPNDVPLKTADDNLIVWDLSLAALGALNVSAQDQGGFWIQLGFGSDFSGHTGSNTPEYLTAALTVSPVPVPAAFWLFGTALIGFVGISRRTRIS